MLNAIGAVLPFAIGVAISPLLLAGEILLLLSPRGPHHGPAFVIGWAGRLALAYRDPRRAWTPPLHSATRPGHDEAIIELVLGPALAVFAIHRWIRRPAAGEPPKTPKWFTKLGTVGPVTAAGLGVFFTALDPKNLPLTAAAALAVANIQAGTVANVVAVIVFVALGSLTVAAPVVLLLAVPQRAQ